MKRKAFSLIKIPILLCLLISCSDDQNDTDPVVELEIEPVVLMINGINPIIGPPGMEVTISGTGFNDTTTNNQLTIAGVNAEVIFANDSILIAEVPDNADTGSVGLTVGQQSVEGPTFTVTPKPIISSFEPQEGSIRTPVTIVGDNFFAVEGEIDSLIVMFNGEKAEVKSTQNDQIKVIVPSSATSGIITIALRGVVIEVGFFDITELQLIYDTEVSVTTLLNIEKLSNVFVTDGGNILLSTNTQILELNSDNSLTTIAGINGISSYIDGPVSSATFGNPYQIVEDSQSNLLISDIQNKAIRKIANNEVTTYFLNDEFFLLFGIGIDNSDNLFIADFGPKIWKLSPEKVLTTFVEYPIVPQGVRLIAIDIEENIYAIVENQVLKITKSGTVTNFAGNETPGIIDGTANDARFNFPLGIAIGPDGYIYVSDAENYLIRKISPEGTVSTVAGVAVSANGDGDTSIATFKRPSSIAFDQMGNLLVADYEESLRLIEFN